MEPSPGEWKATDTAVYAHTISGTPPLTSVERKIIAVVYGDDPNCHEDARMAANAKLLGASKRLLESLKFVVQAYNEDVRCGRCCGVDDAEALIKELES